MNIKKQSGPGPILIGLAGTEISPDERQYLAHPMVGGVVLFTRNFENIEQLKGLVESIHQYRQPRLLVAIDQEGGRVQRFKEGFTRLPPLGMLGRLHREDAIRAGDMAYRHARVMATEMLALGIDISFAPVLDLDRGSHVIGDRSFSDEPGVVTELGRSYLAGLSDAGMKSTAKHFPGHGSVEADSHLENVTDPRDWEAIESADLKPFVALKSQLDAMMIAHVIYPEIDNKPAGYSRRWLHDILRTRLDWHGVVFSDDLGMHAAHAEGGVCARVTACLNAGCDLALVCMPDDVVELFEGDLSGIQDVSRNRAARCIPSLYGKPTVNASELLQVAAEGIREWAYWQQSLEQLCRQT